MNGRAICTLPVPAKPLSLDAPKPGMAFVRRVADIERRVADIERRVGNAVTGWAYNGATPLNFNDAGH
jgi:hypothetical protein